VGQLKYNARRRTSTPRLERGKAKKKETPPRKKRLRLYNSTESKRDRGPTSITKIRKRVEKSVDVGNAYESKFGNAGEHQKKTIDRMEQAAKKSIAWRGDDKNKISNQG